MQPIGHELLLQKYPLHDLVIVGGQPWVWTLHHSCTVFTNTSFPLFGLLYVIQKDLCDDHN